MVTRIANAVGEELRAIGRTLVEQHEIFIGAALLGLIAGMFIVMVRDFPNRPQGERDAFVQQLSTLDWLN